MPGTKLQFSAVATFFDQGEAVTNAATYDYARRNFGLINRKYETDEDFDPEHKKSQWQRFAYYVDHLRNASAGKDEYKVLYLGRHGEGFHNVAEAFYGTAAWDDHWSKLEGGSLGDLGNVTWADAHLTDRGIEQALGVNRFWQRELSHYKIPAPQRYYTSPLHRCLATAHYTFNGLNLPESRPFVPEVKELLRETNGEHTCDRRSTRTYISSEYPDYTIEDGFTEHDKLWRPDWRESRAEHVARMNELLEDVFWHDSSTFISITSHSGSIAALLAAIGHREYSLPTGGVIPVFVKAVRV